MATYYSSRKLSDDISLTDALEFFMLKKLLGIHTVLLCEILAVSTPDEGYYPKMTVQSLINNIANNFAPVNPPLIFDVPCTAIRGGNAGIIIQYKKGDKVLIGIVERQIDNVIRSGKRSTPALHRTHSLEDAVVIAYIPSDKDVLPTIYVKITEDGIDINSNNKPLIISTKSATITVNGDTNINVTGKLTATSTGDAEITSGGVLKLKGASVEIEGTLKINGSEYLQHKHEAGLYTTPSGGDVSGTSGTVL